MKYIITANFGDYEDYTPDYYHEGWKHIYFTDAPREIPNWEVRILDNYDKINRHIKACPHEFLPDVTESWWVDANIRLNKLEPFNDEWVTMEHPYRNNIRDELDACISMKKDDPDIMTKQVQDYLKEGFSGEGLVSSGIIYRRHTGKVKRFGEAWWKEVLNKSRRDQLSFSYVCWKLGFKYSLMPFMHNAEKIKHKFQDKILVICEKGFWAEVLKRLGVARTWDTQFKEEHLNQKNLRVIAVDQTPEVFETIRKHHVPHVAIYNVDSIGTIYKKLARFIPWLIKSDLIKTSDELRNDNR